MSTRHHVALVPLTALILGAACTRGSGSATLEAAQEKGATSATKSTATSAGPASELTRLEAERTATQWLNALRSRDRVQLEKFSSVPFDLRELVQYPKCQPAEALKPADVASAVTCLLEDQLLMEELTAQPAPVTETIAAADLPEWAASLKHSLSANGQLVHVRLPGNGVSYQLLLLATSSGVQRVWKFAEYDPD
jgi:hypothetical protein